MCAHCCPNAPIVACKKELSDKDKIKMLIKTVDMALTIERAALIDAEEEENQLEIAACNYLISEYEKL